ncbi:hypothetical protein D3C78_1403770 [compost metagenome]
MPGQLWHANNSLHWREVVRDTIQVPHHSAIVGTPGVDVDDQIARHHRPRQVERHVDPGVVAVVLQQAQLLAGIQPLAGDPQVLLQVADGLHAGLDPHHAAKALVLRAGHVLQVDPDAVLLFRQLPTIIGNHHPASPQGGKEEEGDTQFAVDTAPPAVAAAGCMARTGQ